MTGRKQSSCCADTAIWSEVSATRGGGDNQQEGGRAMRTRPPSELARMRAHFTANGWDPARLAAFRMEADDGGDGGDSGDTGDGSDDGAGGDDKLGDAGKRAIEAERANARKAKDALKPWKALADEYGMTPEQVREALTKANDGDADKVRKDLERDIRKEITAKANARIVRAEVKALSADTFADPEDAVLNLDVSSYDVDDDGNVDADAIKRDLAEVLKRKPHLAKGGKRPEPDPSQGSSGAGKKESTPGLGRLRDAYAASATK